MTNRLVCSGYAKPGQTSRELIGSFSADVILDIAYAMLVEKLTPEQRESFDKSLDQMDSVEHEKMIERQLADGRVVRISEARLARMKKNLAGVGQMNPLKGGKQ